MTFSRRIPPLLALASLVLTALLLGSAAIAPPAALAAEAWAWPVDGEVLTRYRNGDDPYAAGQHRGIDVGASVGTTVRSATEGTVTFAGTAGSSGLTVAIRTADARFDTSYLHLDTIDVSAGDVVEPGSELGTVGTSGRRSTEAPHLHFGVRDAAERHAYRDPLLFLGAPGSPPPQPPPAPVGAPVREGPRPAPAPAPLPAPASRPVPAPLSHPAPRPSHASSRTPAPAPKGAPAPAAAPSPEAAPRPLPGQAPRRVVGSDPGAEAAEGSPAESPASKPAPVPAPGPVPDPARGPVSLGAASEAVRRQPPGVGEAGIDLGWLVGCAGLGIAAAAAAVPLWRRRPQNASASVGLDARARRGPAASSIDAWPTTSPRRSTT